MADTDKKAAFIEAIEKVCREHGLSISHEDKHGNFIIVPLDAEHMEWLKQAIDRTGEPRG